MQLLGACATVLVAIVAILVGFLVVAANSKPKYLPWHDTPEWERVLKAYENIAAKSVYANCETKLIPTSFGSTHAYACGETINPPVVFFHGAGSTTVVYESFLLPSFVETHYSLAVDFPCDTGRSLPPDGNPEKCPANQEEIAQWVQEFLQGLSISSPASMVGYSYGSFVSAVTALHRPKLVDKLVLIAPAAVFGEITIGFILRVIVTGLVRSYAVYEWFHRYLSVYKHFRLTDFGEDWLELNNACRELGATILAVAPPEMSDDELKQIVANVGENRSILLIGKEERVVDATLAAARAEKAGFEVKVYENAGHLMGGEVRLEMEQDVAAFLHRR